MKISTAVILAAGRGTRLAGNGQSVPKGLVLVGVESLMSRSVRLLARHGIEKIFIITGHQAELYEQFAASQQNVACIFNPNFEAMGSLESLRCALESVAPPFLLLDSDILYESRGLKALLDHPSVNGALVSGPTGSGDEYYVWADESERVFHFSKLLSDQVQAPFGEHVGILKIGPALFEALRANAPVWRQRNPKDFYEALLVSLLAEHAMSGVMVHDLLWFEIDNAAMLETARSVIWPKLQAKGDL